MLRRPVALVAIVLVATFLVGCGSDEPGGQPRGDGAGGELIVEPASYDLAAGENGRFLAGLLTPEQTYVSYGSVEMDFFYLGTKKGSGTAQPGPSAIGNFLAIQGDAGRDGPIVTSASEGRGVYEAFVTFDRAGYWAVEVGADVSGEDTMTGRAVFEVLDEHGIPAPGDPAPRSKNLTVDSKAPPQAIDSRAQGGEKVPDPELHKKTIAGSIEAGHPVVAVFSTPVYCVSRFCGPVTDMIGELEKDYGDRADFIHVEIWWNFQKQVLNKAAAQWLYRNNDLVEPWVFLIDDTGKIAARWDNVAVREEIEPLLRRLPRLD